MHIVTAKQQAQSELSTAQELRYWMQAPAIAITMGAPVSKALALMRKYELRRLPVVLETGELHGMITQSDIRSRGVPQIAGLNPVEIADVLHCIKVYEVMTNQPIAARPETGLREAALLMIEHKIGALPVVDDANRVVGIITESDLFEILVQQLAHIQSDTSGSWSGYRAVG